MARHRMNLRLDDSEFDVLDTLAGGLLQQGHTASRMDAIRALIRHQVATNALPTDPEVLKVPAYVRALFWREGAQAGDVPPWRLPSAAASKPPPGARGRKKGTPKPSARRQRPRLSDGGVPKGIQEAIDTYEWARERIRQYPRDRPDRLAALREQIRERLTKHRRQPDLDGLLAALPDPPARRLQRKEDVLEFLLDRLFEEGAPSDVAPVDTATFADRVLEVVDTAPPYRQYLGQQPINLVWRMYRERWPADAGTLDEFKKRLVRAAKARKLLMAPAELPEMMLEEDRGDSATIWNREKVHLVTNERRREVAFPALADRIERAYRSLVRRSGDWAQLADLREHPLLAEVPRKAVDEELRSLFEMPRDIHLVPNENRKTITDRDRAAALQVGSQHHNMIAWNERRSRTDEAARASKPFTEFVERAQQLEQGRDGSEPERDERRRVEALVRKAQRRLGMDRATLLRRVWELAPAPKPAPSRVSSLPRAFAVWGAREVQRLLEQLEGSADQALPPEPGEPKREGFADRALLAARHSPTGWIGDHLVFISHAYRQFVAEHPSEGLSLPGFKKQLLAAHRKGDLHLSGSDMPQLHDARDVEESTVPYRTSRFVFIRTDLPVEGEQLEARSADQALSPEPGEPPESPGARGEALPALRTVDDLSRALYDVPGVASTSKWSGGDHQRLYIRLKNKGGDGKRRTRRKAEQNRALGLYVDLVQRSLVSDDDWIGPLTKQHHTEIGTLPQIERLVAGWREAQEGQAAGLTLMKPQPGPGYRRLVEEVGELADTLDRERDQLVEAHGEDRWTQVREDVSRLAGLLPAEASVAALTSHAPGFRGGPGVGLGIGRIARKSLNPSRASTTRTTIADLARALELAGIAQQAAQLRATGSAGRQDVVADLLVAHGVELPDERRYVRELAEWWVTHQTRDDDVVASAVQRFNALHARRAELTEAEIEEGLASFRALDGRTLKAVLDGLGLRPDRSKTLNLERLRTALKRKRRS